MGVEALVGRRFGPFPGDTSPSAVARFVAATGDEPSRWSRHVPPTQAAAVLFAAAPALLADPDAAGSTSAIVHSEQALRWERPLEVGEPLAVEGEVAAVRARGLLHLVTFEVRAAGAAGPWLEGRSTFLLSSEPAAAAAEEPEPDHDERGRLDPPELLDLPAAGEVVDPLHVSASRADLVRYAAASGDLNPIHWDHDAARMAGLPGVVVHGLLMASWIGRAAARHAPGPEPLRSLRARFRRPLRPGVPAVITGAVERRDGDGADLALTLEADGTTLVTASVRVTR